MELITPGLGLLFWMTLAFLLLVFILKKFAWGPILMMLKERETSIHEALNSANQAREDMKQLKFSNEQLLQEAKNERDLLLNEARKVRDKLLEEARIKASEEASRIVESAKANSLNVYMYLVHLLTELPKLDTLTPTTLEVLLPWSPDLPSWCKNI